MKKLHLFLGAALLLSGGLHQAYSAEGKKSLLRTAQQMTGTRPFSTLMNINNLSMWIEYDGSSARNPSTGNSGVTLPRGTSTPIFADGLIWGGRDRCRVIREPVPSRLC